MNDRLMGAGGILLFLAMCGALIFALHSCVSGFENHTRERIDYIQEACKDVPGRDYEGCRSREFHNWQYSR